LLSFNGTHLNGNGAAPAGRALSARNGAENGAENGAVNGAENGAVNGAENGAESASLALLPSSRQVVRAHLRVLFRPLRRPSSPHTRRRIEARRRPVTWSSPEELQVELNRSRRFGHPFVLVRVPCGHDEEGGSNGRGEEVARTVSSLLRRVDRVWPDGTSLYLLLPECDRGMGEAMLARIREPLTKHLSDEQLLAISSAVFPEDGFTGGALFDALDGRSISPATRPAELGVAAPTPELGVAVPTPEAPLA
jgi:hypothetical protein